MPAGDEMRREVFCPDFENRTIIHDSSEFFLIDGTISTANLLNVCSIQLQKRCTIAYRTSENVFSRHKDRNLHVSPKKCEFMDAEIPSFGIIFKEEGIRMDSKKVEVLIDWPKPKILTEVKNTFASQRLH